MDTDRIASLLRADESAQRGPGSECPDLHLVAGYVDDGLDASERRAVALHIADCAHCRDLVGILSREHTEALHAAPIATSSIPVPGPAVALPARRSWRVPAQWAAAAALVVTLPLLLTVGGDRERDTGEASRSGQASTRTVTAAKRDDLRMIVPQEGAAMNVRGLAFRWTSVPGTPFYDVRIVSDTGELIIEERVEGTAWQPTARLPLRPGTEYFVQVDAYPSGDKAVSSQHVPFRVVK